MVVPGERLRGYGPDIRIVIPGRAVTKQGLSVVVQLATVVIVPHLGGEDPQGGGTDSLIRVDDGELVERGAGFAVQPGILNTQAREAQVRIRRTAHRPAVPPVVVVHSTR